jgi:flotillin
MTGLLLVGVVTVLVVVGALYMMVKNLLWVSTPNEALIFSGTARKTADGRQVAYRFIRGGRALRRPLVEKVDVMDLSMFTVVVNTAAAFSKGGIPLTVQGVANVKLPGEEPLLSNAVERFLGRTREEIYYIAKETLEGNLRGVLASLTPEEVNEDKQRFAQILLDEAEHDMSRIGLVLDTLKIQNVTDEVNYLASIGRIRSAGMNQTQAIAEAEARADASVQQAANWSASETAKIDADLNIARQETQKRIAEATSRREALIQEARGQVAAQTAQTKAEIDRQKARALQEKRRLDADVVQPAIARQRAAEEAAKGDAASTVERGKAEAGSLHQLVEAYRSGGASARDVLALQNLLPMLAQVSGAHYALNIAKVSVLPASTSQSGGDFARKAIGATEQIRAATGVDLAGVAKKLGG